MKKFLLILFITILLFNNFVLSLTSYELQNINVKISGLDNFLVITRDNINQNHEIDLLGLDKKELFQNLYKNKIYLNAIKYSDDKYLEVILRFSKADNDMKLYEKSISLISEESLDEFAKSLMKTRNSNSYQEINISETKYILLEYEIEGIYINEYVTYRNQNLYSFQFSLNHKITAEEKESIKEIMNTVEYLDKDKAYYDIVLGVFISITLILINIILGFLILKEKNKNDKVYIKISITLLITAFTLVSYYGGSLNGFSNFLLTFKISSIGDLFEYIGYHFFLIVAAAETISVYLRSKIQK